MSRRAVLFLATSLAVLAVLVGVLMAVGGSDPSSLDTTVKPCSELPHGERARSCYAADILAAASRTGAGGAVERSNELLGLQGAAGEHFSIECHETLHIVGKERARLGDTSFVDVPVDSCLAGYVHGVLEYQLADVQDNDLFAATAAICTEKKDFPLCDHLVGHIVARRHLSSLSKVISTCMPSESFATREDKLRPYRCLDGAFMERGLAEVRTEDWRGSVSAAVQGCRDLEQSHPLAAEACFGQAGTKLYIASGDDFAAAVNACAELEMTNVDTETSRQLRYTCAGSVANMFVGMEGPSVEAGVELCSSLVGDAALWCAAGVDRGRYATSGETAGTEVCDKVVAQDDLARCKGLARGPRWSVPA